MLMTMLVVVTLLAVAAGSVVLLLPDTRKTARRMHRSSEGESFKAAYEQRLRESARLH